MYMYILTLSVRFGILFFGSSRMRTCVKQPSMVQCYNSLTCIIYCTPCTSTGVASLVVVSVVVVCMCCDIMAWHLTKFRVAVISLLRKCR